MRQSRQSRQSRQLLATDVAVSTEDELNDYLLDDYTINVNNDLVLTATLSMTGDTGVSE